MGTSTCLWSWCLSNSSLRRSGRATPEISTRANRLVICHGCACSVASHPNAQNALGWGTLIFGVPTGARERVGQPPAPLFERERAGKMKTLSGESERVCEIGLRVLRRERRCLPGTLWGPSADRTPRFRPRSAYDNHSLESRRNERRHPP